jgi:EH domain-containing protein 1
MDTIESVRQKLTDVIDQHLNPLSQRYGYHEISLSSTLKWKPIVLVLGNYSSGKSTLINELIGHEVQQTGQSPTDDSFTVLTKGQNQDTREGSVLLNDPHYPFEHMRRHGQGFSSHFQLKTVDSALLEEIALIDTPGMLDSSNNAARGYNYNEVVYDLAQLADLILIVFDAHKAGTVRELNDSLNSILPRATFENRIVYVLNRIDECESLIDLTKTYGTLCWNLAQVTQRKDIPTILMSYAEGRKAPQYFEHFHNQRSIIRDKVLLTPKMRLDHLVYFVEFQGEKLAHYLEALCVYKRTRTRKMLAFSAVTIGIALCAASLMWVLALSGMFLELSGSVIAWASAGVSFVFIIALMSALYHGVYLPSWHQTFMRKLDEWTTLKTTRREESWKSIRANIAEKLKYPTKLPRRVYKDYRDLNSIVLDTTRRTREVLRSK